MSDNPFSPDYTGVHFNTGLPQPRPQPRALMPPPAPAPSAGPPSRQEWAALQTALARYAALRSELSERNPKQMRDARMQECFAEYRPVARSVERGRAAFTQEETRERTAQIEGLIEDVLEVLRLMAAAEVRSSLDSCSRMSVHER